MEIFNMQELFDLELHDELQINKSLKVVRVIDGLLYIYYCEKSNTTSMTFVSLKEEQPSLLLS